jgi:hypothetical protein
MRLKTLVLSSTSIALVGLGGNARICPVAASHPS